jgi:hypothetical protein
MPRNGGFAPTTEVAILVRVSATEAKIELSYNLALSRWAAMGKASSSLLVNLPKAFLTSVIRAARAASFPCDTGPANGVTQHKSLDRRKAHGPTPLLNCNVLKTCGTNESFQFGGIGQPKWRAHNSCGRLTNMSLQSVSQHSKSGTFVNAAPHHQRESPFGTKNPTHFA